MGNSQLSLFSLESAKDNQQQEQLQIEQRKLNFNPEKQSFIRIATCNQKQSQFILQNINCYQNNKCHSLPRLKEFYHAKNKNYHAYCSNQEFFYIVFEGCTCCSLKEQFNSRRLNGKCFSQQEIRNILQTFLCAVRQYFQVFERNIDKVQLQDISFSHRAKLYMKDPWLRKLKQAISVNQVNILLQYPSPQKLHALNQIQQTYFDPFLSILFSIGVIGLQLTMMNFVDNLYIKHPKQFNFQKMKQLMRTIPQSKLKSGIEILLNLDPENRNQIYYFWGIQLKNQYFLQFIQSKNHQSQYSKSNKDKNTASTQKKFQVFRNSQQTNPINKYLQHDFNHQKQQPFIIASKINSHAQLNNSNYVYPVRLQESVVTKEIQTIRQRPSNQKIVYTRTNEFSNPLNYNSFRVHSLNPHTNVRQENYSNNFPKLNFTNLNTQNKGSVLTHIQFNPQKQIYVKRFQPKIYEQNYTSRSYFREQKKHIIYQANQKKKNVNISNASQIAYNQKLEQTSKMMPYGYRFNNNIDKTVNFRRAGQEYQTNNR